MGGSLEGEGGRKCRDGGVRKSDVTSINNECWHVTSSVA